MFRFLLLFLALFWGAYAYDGYDYENDPFLQQEAAKPERKVVIKDPLESFNKVLFKAFVRADKYVMRPIALAYGYVTPQLLRRGIINFANNFSTPEYMISATAIGGGERAMLALSRFSLNSTFGILGFFDIAKELEMPAKNVTLADVLRFYGSPEGFFLFTPLGMISPPDLSTFAFVAVQDYYFRIGLWETVVQLINTRRENDSQLQTLYSMENLDEMYATLKMIKYTQIKNWDVKPELRKKNTNTLKGLVGRSPSSKYSV